MGSSIRKPLRTLYDDDFHAWSLSQGNALRKLRPAGIDWENLAEEVEALAKKDRRALKSCARTLLAHLLKLGYWRSERAANEGLWRSSVRNARHEIHDILADSPSLMSFLEQEYHDCYRMASADVADLAGVAVPKSPPWKLSAVLNEGFFAKDNDASDDTGAN